MHGQVVFGILNQVLKEGVRNALSSFRKKSFVEIHVPYNEMLPRKKERKGNLVEVAVCSKKRQQLLDKT